MIQRVHPERGPGGMFFLSLCCHAAVALGIAFFQFLPRFHPVEPVTYVDMVTLPVASPQQGSPQAEPTPGPPQPPAPAPAPPKAMTLPAPQPKAKTEAAKAKAEQPGAKKAQPRKEQPVSDEAKHFNDRLQKIEQRAEDQRLAEAVERIRKRRGAVGMPGGTGTQAGADYASYLQSRLKDAFASEVTVSPGKAPALTATVTIAPDGRLADFRVLKYSDDPLFNDAVTRAVHVAGAALQPPPGGKSFRRSFLFRPEGVGVR